MKSYEEMNDKEIQEILDWLNKEIVLIKEMNKAETEGEKLNIACHNPYGYSRPTLEIVGGLELLAQVTESEIKHNYYLNDKDYFEYNGAIILQF